MTPAPGATASATPSGSGSAQLADEVQRVLEEWLDTLTETYEGDWQPAVDVPIHAMSPDALLEDLDPEMHDLVTEALADAVPPADL